MGRAVMLGNGSLTVGLDEHGLVHDFYYPYVGLENLTTARSVHHKIGVWVDGNFSWVDDDNGWNISADFESEALISQIRMLNDELKVELRFSDFVDYEFNAFARKITIKNLADNHREIRLFMHQVFQISRAGRADTALFVPEENYILAYRGRCCLLIYGQAANGEAYDQYAIGSYGIEGKEGTFRDAEDGELSGSAVEHGGVDSVVRFSVNMAPGSSSEIDYWVVAADSQLAGEKIHHELKQQGLNARLEANYKYWREWLDIGADGLQNIDEQYLDLTRKSLLIIKSHIDKRGGIIASCDSSIYNYGRDYYSYVWPRDGVYALWPLIRLGYRDEPKKFFEFCRDVLHPEGYLMHKYQPDKAIGSSWHPLLRGGRKELAIQEDETASVIYMLGEYYRYSADEEFVKSLYETLLQPAANFMASFIDAQTGLPHASYDLWEMKFCTTTYTTAVVYQALLVAAEFAEKFEYPDDALRWNNCAETILKNSDVFYHPDRLALRKGFLLQPDSSLQFEDTLDISSLYGAMMYGLCKDDSWLPSTLKAIENNLLDISPSGGATRFENDGYFLTDNKYTGNPWIVTTLWIAQYYIRLHEPDRARGYLDWACKHSLASGILPEQVNPETGYATSVTPLVWSHAEFINTVLDLSQSTSSAP